MLLLLKTNFVLLANQDSKNKRFLPQTAQRIKAVGLTPKLKKKHICKY
jgi:hypothetical protein